MNFTDMRRRNSGIWQRRREQAEVDTRKAISDWDLFKFSGQLNHQIWYEVWALDNDRIWNKTNPNGGLHEIWRG